MENDNLVSIIMPCFNGAKFIGESIECVIAQDYQYWELIIIDDCSTDNSIEIVKSYMLNDARIHLLQNDSNKHVVFSRNRGIEFASGRYIAFLDCDDIWYRLKLSLQLKLLRKVNGFFCYTSYDVINSLGNKIGEQNVPDKIDYNSLLERCDIGCSTVLYDSQKIGKFYFNTTAPRTGEDYIMWFEMIKKIPGGLMFGLTEKVVAYRKHEGGISANKIYAALNIWKVYHYYEKLGYIKSTYYVFRYFIYWLKKHKKKSNINFF